ncbi:hypothetical protein A3770_03p26950 [Chloropicon primus]|uniref:Uncharacterized protein n=4 Tax=Chloropicon primus TaxID=1764295 RepID=A0A5B8MIA6_9CHLO|nr:hypothetical protein A3770_03p26950 [Chloropicon primus]|eukprot:QDZ20177.1 hypothetical protein A3770_03p26950 [Chloropicon primus]
MHLPGSQFFLTGLLKSTLKVALRRGVDVEENVTAGVEVNPTAFSLRVSDLHLYRESTRESILGWSKLELGASLWPPSVYASINDSFVDLTTQGLGGDEGGGEGSATGSPPPEGDESPAAEREAKEEGDPLFLLLWKCTNPGFLLGLRIISHPLLALLSIHVRRLSARISKDGEADQVVRVGRFVIPPHMRFVGKSLRKRFLGSELSYRSNKACWSKVVSKIVSRRKPGPVERLVRDVMNFVALSLLAFTFYSSFYNSEVALFVFEALGLPSDRAIALSKVLLATASSSAFVSSLFPNMKVRKAHRRCFEMRLELQSSNEGLKAGFRIPNFVFLMDQNDMRGMVSLRNCSARVVVQRAENGAMALQTLVEFLHAQMTVHGGGGAGNIIVDNLVCTARGTLNSDGEKEMNVDCSLPSVLLHSQKKERDFHQRPQREGKIGVELQQPKSKLYATIKPGFIFVGTAALAKLLHFTRSTKTRAPATGDDVRSQGQLSLPPSPEAKPKKVLNLDFIKFEVHVGSTGRREDIYFGLGVTLHLQYYSEASIRYLGIDRSWFALKSLRELSESYIVRRTSLYYQKRLDSKEGGLEVSPFSILLSLEEALEIGRLFDEEWRAKPKGDGAVGRGADQTTRPPALEGMRVGKTLLRPLESKDPLVSPGDGDTVALRCRVVDKIVHTFFAIDLKTHEAMVSHLAPNLLQCNSVCSLFKVHRIRGSKFFRLGLCGYDGWENYFVALGKKGKVTISRFGSVFGLDRTGKIFCKKERLPLSLSKRGIFFFHKGTPGQVELVGVGSAPAAPVPVFEMQCQQVQLHLLSRKDETVLDEKAFPLVTDGLDHELCRIVLSLSTSVLGSRCVSQMEVNLALAVLLRDSEDPSEPMLTACQVSRVVVCSSAAIAGHQADNQGVPESLFGVYLWSPMDIEINECAIECLAIILQGLQGATVGKFHVRHLRKLQSTLCVTGYSRKKRTTPKARKPAKAPVSGTQISVYHVAQINFKVVSTQTNPKCQLLVGRLVQASARTGASVGLDDTRVAIHRFDIDTHHPDAESVVCLRRRGLPNNPLRQNATQGEAAQINVHLRLESAPANNNSEEGLSLFLYLSPVSIVVHEPIVQQLMTLFPTYNKKEVEAARKIQKAWKGNKQRERGESGAKTKSSWGERPESESERLRAGSGGRKDPRKRKWFWGRRDQGKLDRSSAAATKIQKWWRKKKDGEVQEKKRRASGWMDGNRKIKVIDVLLPDIEATFKLSRSSDNMTATLAQAVEVNSVLSDFETILNVLGAPEIGTVHLFQKRILLSDIEMSGKDIAKTVSQQLTQSVLLAIARESVDFKVPWVDTAVDQYLEAVGNRRGTTEPGEKQDRKRGGNWITRPWRLFVDPLVFVCRATAASVKHAGWTIIISTASDMTDSAVKGAETNGLKGVYSAVTLSSLRMLTTPPKQAMFRLWASRNALTSDLTATFRLSEAVGMNDTYLEAYLQGIVDHVFQLKNCQVSIEDNLLSIRNLPILESEREELLDYVEFIMASEGLIEGDELSTKKSMHITGLDSSSFSAKLRHLSQKRKDPRRQLLMIVSSFVQNVAIVLASGSLARALPFHKLVRRRCGNKWVRRGLGTAIVFGYRRLSWVIPTSFAKKVCHTYLLSLAFSKEEEEEGGEERQAIDGRRREQASQQ